MRRIGKRRKENIIKTDGATSFMYYKEHEIIFDSEDMSKVQLYKWQVDRKLYVTCTVVLTNGKRRRILLHRLVTGATSGMVDHINRNPLDNRKSNLRFASNIENRWNSGKLKRNKTGFKGVRQHSANRFEAQITVNGKKIYLGLHKTKEAAALAFDRAAKEYCGQFAYLNFPTKEIA